MNADRATNSYLESPTREQLDAMTRKIIGCAHRVSNELGHGFPEKLYQRALAIEFDLTGLSVQMEVPARVTYRGKLIGEFRADLVVEKAVLVEVKATAKHSEAFDAQCLNYLRATGLRVCLLLNFGSQKVKVRRFVNNF